MPRIPTLRMRLELKKAFLLGAEGVEAGREENFKIPKEIGSFAQCHYRVQSSLHAILPRRESFCVLFHLHLNNSLKMLEETDAMTQDLLVVVLPKYPLAVSRSRCPRSISPNILFAKVLTSHVLFFEARGDSFVL